MSSGGGGVGWATVGASAWAAAAPIGWATVGASGWAAICTVGASGTRRTWVFSASGTGVRTTTIGDSAGRVTSFAVSSGALAGASGVDAAAGASLLAAAWPAGLPGAAEDGAEPKTG